MDKIYKRLDKLSEDEALSLLYDEKEREEEKKQAEIEYAEEHGLNKGISQGIKQTAKNMLERNMNIDVVAEITGLSLEEVIKLKEDI
ncbi:MAG: transposase, partial [Bacilli bacterium]|nr:transposase [Bacilli bacterium]